MLTEQYKKFIKGVVFGQTVYCININGDSGSMRTGYSGTIFTNTRNVGTAWSYLVLGTNDIPATEEDTTWDNGVDLTCLSSSVVNNVDTCFYILTETFQNNTGASVTVKEVGLAVSGDNANTLIGRLVLENPITIANGETYSFNYTIC